MKTPGEKLEAFLKYLETDMVRILRLKIQSGREPTKLLVPKIWVMGLEVQFADVKEIEVK